MAADPGGAPGEIRSVPLGSASLPVSKQEARLLAFYHDRAPCRRSSERPDRHSPDSALCGHCDPRSARATTDDVPGPGKIAIFTREPQGSRQENSCKINGATKREAISCY